MQLENAVYVTGSVGYSIPMINYYCKGTGCSLSSKYSLQESILLTSCVTYKVGTHPKVPYSNKVPYSPR